MERVLENWSGSWWRAGSVGGRLSRRAVRPAGEGVGVGRGDRAGACSPSLIDWLLGYLIAAAVQRARPVPGRTLQWTVLAIWFVLTAVPGRGSSGPAPGMTALGIRVRVDRLGGRDRGAAGRAAHGC